LSTNTAVLFLWNAVISGASQVSPFTSKRMDLTFPTHL
jgi:hypothetical protein